MITHIIQLQENYVKKKLQKLQLAICLVKKTARAAV